MLPSLALRALVAALLLVWQPAVCLCAAPPGDEATDSPVDPHACCQAPASPKPAATPAPRADCRLPAPDGVPAHSCDAQGCPHHNASLLDARTAPSPDLRPAIQAANDIPLVWVSLATVPSVGARPATGSDLPPPHTGEASLLSLHCLLLI